MRNALLFALLSCVLILLPRCAGPQAGGPATQPPGRDANADTIRKEVMASISRRVLAGIPEEGRLKEVRERGVLRVALPPPNPPFLRLDPGFEIPVGFHPALVGELAAVLNVKSNVTVLFELQASGLPDGWDADYDLAILPEWADGCRREREVKFFFMGQRSGWKSFCVADAGGESLTRAISETLTYLNETGVFARLHKTYVKP